MRSERCVGLTTRSSSPSTARDVRLLELDPPATFPLELVQPAAPEASWRPAARAFAALARAADRACRPRRSGREPLGRVVLYGRSHARAPRRPGRRLRRQRSAGPDRLRELRAREGAADARDRRQRLPARGEVRRRGVVRSMGQARAGRARARGDARLRARLVRLPHPRARRPAGGADRPLRPDGAGPARGPRSRARRQGPPARGQGVRQGGQRPHDQLVDHPVLDAGVGVAGVPGPPARGGAGGARRAAPARAPARRGRPDRRLARARRHARRGRHAGSPSAASTRSTTRVPAPT